MAIFTTREKRSLLGYILLGAVALFPFGLIWQTLGATAPIWAAVLTAALALIYAAVIVAVYVYRHRPRTSTSSAKVTAALAEHEQRALQAMNRAAKR